MRPDGYVALNQNDVSFNSNYFVSILTLIISQA